MEGITLKLICCLTDGYPSIPESAEISECYAAGGCDIIQIELPARNPYLESDRTAFRMASALVECDNYQNYLDNIVWTRQYMPHIRILLYLYDSTVREIGVKKLIEFCRENEINDITLTGNPDDDLKSQLADGGLRLSACISLKPQNNEMYAVLNSNGIIFLQTEGELSEYPELSGCIGSLRKQGVDREIFLKGGISKPADLLSVRGTGADGAVIGTDILNPEFDKEKLIDIVASFKQAL